MKAWCIEDPREGTQEVVFADTRNQAKLQSNFDCGYLVVRATRHKAYDNLEHLSNKELARLLWRDGWLLFSDTWSPDDTDTDDAFDAWWTENYE